MKPFAESSEQNKQPILEVLEIEFANLTSILEVGSGTGQHAVFFAEQMPHLDWTCSDLEDNHAGIRMWMKEANLPNIKGPLLLDALQPWPEISFDGTFSANAIHIMSWDAVKGMMNNIGRILRPGGKLCLYGPFMYDGEHTSESNVRFDGWLRQRNPLSGVRDVSRLTELADAVNIKLIKDYEMPVNNRILVWQKL